MWKILYKNILALYRYCDFRVGIFYFASPCMSHVIMISDTWTIHAAADNKDRPPTTIINAEYTNIATAIKSCPQPCYPEKTAAAQT